MSKTQSKTALASIKSGKPTASQPGGQVSCALQGICLVTVFLVRLEVSVLTLVIPPIALEFNCSLELAAWVTLAPNFASIMTAPPVGKASDMYGHAVTWRCAVCLLVLSTWLAAWSPSFAVLLVARVATGVSQSGIFAPSLAMLTTGVSPERRGMISSRIQAADTLGASFGMLAGGIAMDYVDWRWIFLVPAPCMTLAFAMSLCAIGTESAAPDTLDGGSLERFDLAGTLLFSSCSFCFLMALNRGNDLGWNSPMVLALAVGAGVQIPLLVWAEGKAAQPILPLQIFAGRLRSLLLLVLALASPGYTCTLLFVPLFMQDARGMKPSSIGKLLVVRPLCGSLICAAMTRLLDAASCSKHTFMRLGACGLCFAYGMLNILAKLPLGTQFYVGLEFQLGLQALGHFMTILSANALLVSAVPHDQLANASAMQGVIRQVASLLIVTLNLAIIRALGSERQPECYAFLWVLLLALAVTLVMVSFVVPVDGGQAYDTISEQEAESHEPCQASRPELKEIQPVVPELLLGNILSEPASSGEQLFSKGVGCFRKVSDQEVECGETSEATTFTKKPDTCITATVVGKPVDNTDAC